MVRMQIQLTDAQAERLRRVARNRGVSIASLVREAVDRSLAGGDPKAEAWQRALTVMGAFAGPGGSVATEHDAWFADAAEADAR